MFWLDVNLVGRVFPHLTFQESHWKLKQRKKQTHRCREQTSGFQWGEVRGKVGAGD